MYTFMWYRQMCLQNLTCAHWIVWLVRHDWHTDSSIPFGMLHLANSAYDKKYGCQVKNT